MMKFLLQPKMTMGFLHKPMLTRDVQISSRESIKPSSPTPTNLRTFDLSFFDQIAPPIYVPILLFYSNNGDNHMGSPEICRRLKTSLWETLSCFYPVAGRISEDFSIVCNDDGVDYSEARVNAQLSDVISEPNVDLLKTFLPCDGPYLPESRSRSGLRPLVGIQVNVFDCEGVVISVCMAHEIADAVSVVNFINSWAAKALDTNHILNPISSVSSLFPRRDLLGFSSTSWVHSGSPLVTKRFVFDSTSISSLRAKASNPSYLTNPSRVVTLSAFIWKRFWEMVKAKERRVKEYGVLHTVNVRGTITTPLPVEEPTNTFGNIFTTTITHQDVEDENDQLHVIAGKLKNSIKQINGEFLRKLQSGDDQYLKSVIADIEKIYKGDMELMVITSWCRFPLYEADFGWGKPRWITTTGMHMKNLVTLTDTRSGDGIEASVTMVEEDMAVFEQDQELLSFATLTPSA